MSDYLLEVEHLQKHFPIKGGGFGKNKKVVQALDDLTFGIKKGETLGMVGESGCGKTTAGRTILRLHEPTNGKIIYDGEVLFDKDDEETASDEYIEKMHKHGLLLWVNAIIYNYKKQLSAGHSDDVSIIGKMDDGWGWLADKKYDIVQTDWYRQSACGRP